MKKLLSWILVLAMVLSMFAGGTVGAFADSTDPEKVTATFYGHNVFFADIDLFESNASGEKVGSADLLEGITPVDDTYTVELEPGYYLAEGKKEVGTGDDAALKSTGTILLNVTAESKDFSLCAITGIKASNSGWKRGEDYEVAVSVADKDKNERVITLSDEIEGNLSCLALDGDTVTAVYTPTAKHPDYIEERYSRTYNANTSSHSSSMKQVVEVSITAPENSTVDMGKGPGSDYYIYTFYDAKSTETSGSNEVSTFRVPVNTDVFYRVQNPSGVTYWNWGKYTTNSAVTVSAENLHIGDAAFTKSTLNRSFSNLYDMANIYINGNEAGYINLPSGGSYELNCFRNWMAIESISNAKVALPDMHYQVIDFSGNTSDVITVTPHAKNSCVADIEANTQGTAIVLVTYDAMTHEIAYGSTGANGNLECKKFSAIWPEFTGVLVVSVGEDGTSVAKNMTMDRPGGSPTVLDAEHDIFFYAGDEGATYTFKPEAGATVSIARPVVSSTDMTYSGFATDGITTDGEGNVTLTGLKNGRNIVKIEKGGVANYQVITARQVSYTMKDASGNLITDANKPKAGDKVCLQFTGLVNPAEKLSGVYNFNASLFYTGEDESTFKSNPGGGFGMYDFSGKPERQYIEITIPKYWAADTYSLTGVIKMGGFGGPLTAHRGITYATGKNPNFSAPGVSMVMSCLPDLSIALGETNFLTGKLSFKDNNGNTVSAADLRLTVKDADGNAVQVADNGTFKGVAETFSYEIAGDGYAMKTGSFTMTDDGSNEFEIELTKLVAGAWNGSTVTEPAKDGDIYQVTNGAEMAWVAQQSAKQDLKAKLVNDIELGGYPWINKESSSNKTFIFDGNGKTVSGLNATKGLFGAIGKDSVVKDLTVRGQSTGGGGVVGYINGAGASVENCVNYVEIKSTGNTVGGVVGYATSNTTVKKCLNYGSVEGKKDVGGIIGGFVGNCTVEECVNYGEVKCTEANAGGIFGGTGYAAVIKNCYNEGAVSGTGAVGGIGGELKGGRDGNATVENCYSCGTVTGVASFGAFGNVGGKVVTTNNAYLTTAGNADANAEALTAAELKSFDFGAAFTLACRRYPALTWETGITLHTSADNPRVVAPGCLTKGYTEHTCTVCNETYRDTYTAPLGHLKGAGAVEDDYKCVYTCERCHDVITEWKDARFEFMTLKAPEITNIGFTDGAFKWEWNKTTSRYESNNVGVDKSKAETTLNFTVVSAGALSFDYGVSSEAKYDKMTLILKKGDEEIAKVADAISGEVTTSYAITLATPGAYSLSMSFAKDDSSASGKDLGFIGNLAFAVGGSGSGSGEGGSGTGGGNTPDKTIHVSMRLIGAEIAKQDVDLGKDAYLPNYVTWIATTGYDMPEGSTVYDLWVEATRDAKIKSEGADNNYVSTVYAPSGYALSEMTNGPRSGWMYTINGKHPNLGLKEQTLSAKDKVVWHYVNDYSYEVEDWFDTSKFPALGDGTYYNGWLKAADRVAASGGGHSSGSTATENTQITEETKPTSGTPAVEKVETTATVKDGKATAEVKATDVTKAIEKVAAEKTETKEVVLEIKGTSGANAVEAAIPTAAAKELAKANVAVTINTGCGTAEIPADTLKNIVGQAGNSDLKVTIENKKTEEAAKAAGGTENLEKVAGVNSDALAKADVVEVTMTAGDKNITKFGGNKLSLRIPLAGNQKAGSIYKGAAISADGTTESITAKCVVENGVKYAEVGTSHLTTFVITNEELKNPFTDVKSGDYFFQPVLWAVDKEVTGGMTADTFAPNAGCTRAQMVTFLWRAAGKPWASANKHFSDVADGAYYKEAVEWAIAAGITNGISEEKFNPNGSVTREQLASFIYRYAQSNDSSLKTDAATALSFNDAGKVSAWANEAMHWCVEKEIVGGTGNNMLTPQGTATRGQIVTMLYRFFTL